MDAKRALAIALAYLTTATGLHAEQTPAERIVDSALQAHGRIASGSITLTLGGSFDLATRLQGRTLAAEPTAIHERITIDFDRDRVAYDLRWHNYRYSVQDLREIYDAENRILFLDRRNRNGGWLAGAPVADARRRLARYLPQVLLAEALAHGDTLRWNGRIGEAERTTDVLSFTAAGGEQLTLYIDVLTRSLRGASAMIDMPLLGSTEIMWAWSDYETRDGLRLPGRFRSWLGNKPLKEASVDIRPASADDAFEIPADIEVGDPPPPQTPAQFIPPAQRPPVVETIAERVHLVRGLRPGFHLMFVEFDDYVVAIDAPTGWYEMQQIPPMNWSHGDTTSALSEKYLRAIAATVPGKPVRHVVLTHHHSDHIGGVRAFLAAGATIIAGEPAARMAAQAAASPLTLGRDAWSGRETSLPAIEIVHGEHRIDDGTMTLQLIELPAGNPKADGYLMVYIPQHRLVYATAFIYPVPPSVFPLAESVDLSIYFVEWLDRAGLDVETVYNVHGTGRVEPWQLERIRELSKVHVPAWQKPTP